MQRYIAGLSLWGEFTIVVFGAFGYFILGSALSVFAPAAQQHITESHLWFLVIYEPIVFVALALFLRARGWTLNGNDFAPTFAEAISGAALAILTYLTCIVIWLALATAFPHMMRAAQGQANDLVAPGIGFLAIIAVSIVNSVFEEVFVSGYIISSLKERVPIWTAINISVAVRLIYHLYQGIPGIVTIIPTGLIFALWYVRRGKLWPLVIAHAALDLVGLSG